MRDNDASPTFLPPSDGRTPSVLRSLVTMGFTGRAGTARVGVLVAAAAVAAGLSIGHGFSATSAKSGYDLAWLADGHRGQVVQVDPVLGRTNVRLQVAQAGDDLDIQQGNGQLIVVDHNTGKITSIDLGTLLVGGNRAETSGSDVKVLLAGPRMYVANLAVGTVQAVDPSTEANIGTPWSAGGPLVDVGIDGQHHVWALGQDEQLTSLVWEPNAATLKPVSRHALTGTGNGSVIVGHKRGVTVVGAQGTIARVGTDHDSTLTSKQTHGPLSAPQSSPDGIVPVADPANSSIVIVSSTGAVVDRVDSLGCSRPGSPLVFRNKVYVPCLGAGQVVVLDQNGNAAADPIRTPGGSDPQLTVSDGHLLVSAPGAGTATVVDGSGKTRTFPTVDPKAPVQNPTQTPPPPPSPAPASPGPQHGDNTHGGRDDPGSSGGGANNGPGSSGPSEPADHGSAAATATARPDGTVLVNWSGPAADGGYEVRYGSNPVADVPSGATSAVVTVLDPGTTTALTVHGLHHGQDLWTATTNTVTVLAPGSTGGPGGGAGVVVSDITYSRSSTSGGTPQLSVSWTASGTAGGVHYTVSTSWKSPSDTTRVKGTDVTTSTASATVPVGCGSTGCTGTITITPSSAGAEGAAASAPFFIPAAGDPAPTQSTTPPPAPAPSPTPEPTPSPVPTTAPAPTSAAPVPLPAAGEQLVSTSATIGSDLSGNPGTITVTVTAPSDWASWSGGSCALIVDGSASAAVPCNASGVTQAYEYYASGSHTFAVRATATDQRTADSATTTQAVVYRPDTSCNPDCCEPQFVGPSSQRYCGCNTGPPPRTICPFTGNTPADAAKPARQVTGTVKAVRLPVITAAAYRSQRDGDGWLTAAAISLGGLVLLGAGGIGAVVRRRRWSR